MRTAFAYIDPAAGGLILQVLVGGLAGAAVFFRTRIQRLFGKSATPESEAAVDAEA